MDYQPTLSKKKCGCNLLWQSIAEEAQGDPENLWAAKDRLYSEINLAKLLLECWNLMLHPPAHLWGLQPTPFLRDWNFVGLHTKNYHKLIVSQDLKMKAMNLSTLYTIISAHRVLIFFSGIKSVDILASINQCFLSPRRSSATAAQIKPRLWA